MFLHTCVDVRARPRVSVERYLQAQRQGACSRGVCVDVRARPRMGVGVWLMCVRVLCVCTLSSQGCSLLSGESDFK